MSKFVCPICGTDCSWETVIQEQQKRMAKQIADSIDAEILKKLIEMDKKTNE